jgi:hypothetical protein
MCLWMILLKLQKLLGWKKKWAPFFGLFITRGGSELSKKGLSGSLARVTMRLSCDLTEKTSLRVVV